MLNAEEEFYRVILQLSRHDAFKHIMLIGSWTSHVYKDHYGIAFKPLQTRDIDFSVIQPNKPDLQMKPNIHEILTTLGYTTQFALISKDEKYVPEIGTSDNRLNIEFLCQPGKFIKENTGHRVKGLGITTTPLQYQKYLLENNEFLKYKDIEINVPKPIYWAIHKIAVSQFRKDKYKSSKDLDQTIEIIKYFGKDRILEIAMENKGKFLKAFNKGWEILRKHL